MKSRWILLLTIGAVPLLAHADWAPAVYNDDYVVTVGAAVNGSYGQITYRESRFGGGNNYLGSVARDVYSVTSSLKTELNNQVREMATREQINFTSGNLYGDANVTLQPDGRAI